MLRQEEIIDKFQVLYQQLRAMDLSLDELQFVQSEVTRFSKAVDLITVMKRLEESIRCQHANS